MRKGSKKFAEELETLTGKSDSIGPPSEFILNGSNIEVKCGIDWWPATVLSINTPPDAPKTYSVKYKNDKEENDVPQARVRPITKKDQLGGVLFLDEAYDLDPANNPEGKAILAVSNIFLKITNIR